MTDAIKETSAEVPPNPFTYKRADTGKGQGMEWLEFQAPLLLTAPPTAEEKRPHRVITQQMQLQKGISPYDQVLQLFRRCEYFEREYQRLLAEVDHLKTENAALKDHAYAHAEMVEGRKKRIKEG